MSSSLPSRPDSIRLAQRGIICLPESLCTGLISNNHACPLDSKSVTGLYTVGSTKYIWRVNVSTRGASHPAQMLIITPREASSLVAGRVTVYHHTQTRQKLIYRTQQCHPESNWRMSYSPWASTVSHDASVPSR